MKAQSTFDKPNPYSGAVRSHEIMTVFTGLPVGREFHFFRTFYLLE
jgi:hypothetical protein